MEMTLTLGVGVLSHDGDFQGASMEGIEAWIKTAAREYSISFLPIGAKLTPQSPLG